jgi:hypothetical protein
LEPADGEEMADTGPKDLFSTQSKLYANFRPTYPSKLYEFIFRHLDNRDAAWDCATGNGQVANYLANHFIRVMATDISQQQLDHAIIRNNITYLQCPAERTPFPAQSFDLITVGQALHWFNREQFYSEVNRVARKKALLAVWGYTTLFIDAKVDPHLNEFYGRTVGPYWDNARRLVEEQYSGIRFPFEEINAPKFTLSVRWSLDHLTGYLSSWSATQQFIRANQRDPVAALRKELEKKWPPGETKSARFPLFLRLLRIS